MTKRKRKKVNPDESDSKVFAFLATFLSIIGFIIALIARKDNEYVMYYAKQSLIVFLAAIVIGIIDAFLMIVPILGWLIISALNIIVLALWIVSWIYALSGEMKPVPFIGQYAKKIKL